jgi:nitrite reductase/ring-hydroxylating ferredoxin subunit/uncharacterized membrane protein
MAAATGLPRVVLDQIESRTSLDATSKVLQRVVARVLRNQRVRGLLSGTALGHPLHPTLTDLPIGCAISSAILDLSGQAPAASRRLLGTAVVLAAPTALAGWSDWLDTEGAEQRVGLVHAVGNIAGLSLLSFSWRQRRRGATGKAVAAAGLGLMSLSGWLGGHLSFGMGVGVDTNAFETGPDEWRATTSRGDATGPLRCHEVDGVRIAVARVESELYAVADRCSHRGGPLSEGQLEGECVTRPWHASRFDLRTGAVRRGPASAPQPVYEVREHDGTTEVRRNERRALRRHPV